MKVNKLNRKGYTVTLEIEEEYNKITEHWEEAFKEVSKDVKLPGFRPGKVPRAIFEKQFGKDYILEVAANKAMNGAYQAAIKEKELEPVDFPRNVEVKSLKENEPLVFTLEIDVVPEVKLGKYKGLKVEKKEAVVGDAEVQKQLEEMQENYAEYVLAEGRGIQDGDIVGYDVKAFVGDEPINKLTRTNSGTKVGSKALTEAFDKALLGMKPQEIKEFEVTFPADHADKDLAGKNVKFNILINEVREKKLPEVNDELVKKVSPFQTLAELKADMKEKMQKQAAEQAENEFKDALIREMIKECEVELPKAVVEREIDRMINNLEYSLAQSRMNLDKYMQILGKDMKGLREEFKPRAEERAKSDLILDAIAKKEKIEATAEDIDKELTEIAKGVKDQPVEESKAKVSEQTKEYVKSYLKDRKTLDFLIEHAKIAKK